MTKYEDAKRCPKCDQPGELKGTSVIERGARVETYHCMNEDCSWFNTGWAVQINRDGSIPEHNTSDPKQFALPDWAKNAADREINQTAHLFGLDRDPEDPEYGKAITNDVPEIRRP